MLELANASHYLIIWVLHDIVDSPAYDDYL